MIAYIPAIQMRNQVLASGFRWFLRSRAILTSEHWSRPGQNSNSIYNVEFWHIYFPSLSYHTTPYVIRRGYPTFVRQPVFRTKRSEASLQESRTRISGMWWGARFTEPGAVRVGDEHCWHLWFGHTLAGTSKPQHKLRINFIPQCET